MSQVSRPGTESPVGGACVGSGSGRSDVDRSGIGWSVIGWYGDDRAGGTSSIC